MKGFTIAPDPYTRAEKDAAMIDDYDHEVIEPWFTGQGPGIRCGQVVKAPTSSVYGIRPCSSVTIEVDGMLRHFNYPRRDDGSRDWTERKVGR